MLNAIALQNERQTTCTQYVRAVLRANGWLLVEPEQFSAEIWQTIQTVEQDRPFKQQLHTLTWQQYGVVLHECCRSENGWRYEIAWQNIAHWLHKCVWRVTQDESLHERLVQESLIALERSLDLKSLDAPAAVWAYALQIMRHRNIDIYRRASAEKRREDQQISLEALQDNSLTWEELLIEDNNPPPLEETVISAETYERLNHFFSAELPTLLQQKVATLHFCEGLAPKQIAATLNKSPHQIRMAKARVVQHLRTLSPAKHAALLLA